MKTGLLVLITIAVGSGAPLYAQHTQGKRLVTLHEKNASVNKLLNAIEQQTHYTISRSCSGWISIMGNMDLDLLNATIDEAMTQCLKNLPFNYKKRGNVVSITVKDIEGKVVNTKGEPIEGIVVTIKGTCKTAVTDAYGRFILDSPPPGDSLSFESMNVEPQTVKITSTHYVPVTLKNKTIRLDSVLVTAKANTGYQVLSDDFKKVSYAIIDKKRLDHSINSDITYLLEGRVPGLQVNKNLVQGSNQPLISIRGISTFFANSNPLIVIDNFPFEGDMNNINLNDIESITVLKDAAAAAIWGMRAGNGVIVLTTKKGSKKHPLQVEGSSRTSLVSKPNLNDSRDFTGAADYIDFEVSLFKMGYFDDMLNGISHPAVSPVVEILAKVRSGEISSAAGDAQIAALKNNDVRKDLSRYVYRKSVNQAYTLTLSGGSKTQTYNISLGYDRNPGYLVANDYDRKTVSLRNNYQPTEKLQFSTNIMYMVGTTHNNDDGKLGIWLPYTSLEDSRGNARPVTTDWRDSYTDTAGGGKLLDWKNRPIDELKLANNTIQSKDLYISANMQYAITPHFRFNIAYRYGRGGIYKDNFYGPQTYFVRNKVNLYTQINGDVVTRQLPLGGIDDQGRNLYTAADTRFQADFNDTLGHHKQHLLTAIAGAEQPTVKTQTSGSREYGIVNGQANNSLNFQTAFPMFNNPSISAKIDNPIIHTGTVINVISYYTNLSYSFKNRYSISASGRIDASNIYGVKTNQKSLPLWSASLGWNILEEPFFRNTHLNVFRIRLSDGYNGNFSTTASAYNQSVASGNNIYGTLTNTVVNAANPSLRWEKNHILNLGIDLSTARNRFECSVDGYIKKGLDLIGIDRMDPTTGVLSALANTAGMISHGVDLSLGTTVYIGPVKWNSNFVFTYADNKITHYGEEKQPAWQYTDPLLNKPMEGYSRYSLAGFRWRGLDPTNGDPQGEWQGRLSKDYYTITNSKDSGQLVHHGSSVPVFSGGLCNTFTWKQWQLSFDIIYKLGYYFRRSSVDYNAMATGASMGNVDYGSRWQHPGDETKTSIPSVPKKMNAYRDLFYTYSDALITKGDHVRLQSILLSYDIVGKPGYKPLHFEHLQVCLSAYNIGILWKANRYGIDPDNLVTTPGPLTVSAGVKIIF